MKLKSLCAIVTLVFALAWQNSQALDGSPSVEHLRLESPAVADGENAPFLPNSAGEIEVVVRLDGLSVSEINEKDALRSGKMLSSRVQRSHAAALTRNQQALLPSIEALGGHEVARLTKVLNAVIVSIDPERVQDLASLPGVVSVRPVGSYELDLDDTVLYIGAAAAQAAGVDGSGVTVAVLDSGIDYTHRNLGGEGTLAAYEAAYGVAPGDPRNETLDGLFPTDKVIGGYDFVGEAWPTNGERSEDPDPIDYGGHGSHVADIIAGLSSDGLHKGVAPGAQLYALKVCSAISTSCNGVALLLGMEFAVDPDGDGDLSDAVDVVNMSLGSSYGQIEDDLSLASRNAVRLGVVVVAASGNSGDRPYITSSPAATPEVISVAQTQVPSASATGLEINTPAAISGTIYNTTVADWAPVTAAVTGDVAYDTTNPLGDSPFPPGYFAGKVALIDRGAVTFVSKAVNAANAGAVLVIIVNNSGDPVGMGGTAPFPLPPVMMISTADGARIKDALAAGETVNVTVDPAGGLSLAGSMVASSARGPSVSFNAIKPDIGAPGASVSAIAGTGDGESPFSGTSGATPMVAGSAALLLQADPARTPGEVKALLMNTAETEIYTNPVLLPGELAPITRIGGGEVRVDQALTSLTAAWAEDDEKDSGAIKAIKTMQGMKDDKKATAYAVSLSFGFTPVIKQQTLSKTVRVTNYADVDRIYSITPTFRYADDEASGAVVVKAPATVKVKGNSSATFQVRMDIDGSLLPPWYFDLAGANGGNGPLLAYNEFDGYLVIADDQDTVSLPWQVLPQRAASIKVNGSSVYLVDGAADFMVENQSSVSDGEVEFFSLLGSSGQIPKQLIPGPGDNYAVVDLKSVGARLLGTNVAQIAIATYGRRAHPNYPGGFQVELDYDGDGATDAIVYNAELSGFAATGQNVVFVGPAGGPYSAYFYTQAQLDSGKLILTFPLSVLGLSAGDTVANMTVYAYDNYFSGIVSDVVETGPYTFGTPRYFAGYGVSVPPLAKGKLSVQAVPGGEAASGGQSGILLLYKNSTDPESDEIRVNP